MTGLNDCFIKRRRSIIDRVTGENTNHVLNASRNNPPNFSGRDAAAEIKIALDQFKTAAIDKNGQRVSLDDIEHGILRANMGFPYLPVAHFSSDDLRLGWAVHELDARIALMGAWTALTHTCNRSPVPNVSALIVFLAVQTIAWWAAI